MFGIGANELVIILLFGFLIFGPDKLPAMAKTIGQMIARFRSAQAEMSRVIKTEVYDPDAEDPFKNPLDALSKIENSAKKEDRGESFTERKARYDKQRAARKAAEERKAEAEAKRAAAKAAKEAAEAEGAAEGTSAADVGLNPKESVARAATAGSGAAAAKAADAQASDAQAASSAASEGTTDRAASAAPDAPEPKKKLTADELYGTTSKAKKPTAKSAPAKPAADPVPDPVEAEAKAKAKTAEEATDAPSAPVSSTPGKGE